MTALASEDEVGAATHSGDELTDGLSSKIRLRDDCRRTALVSLVRFEWSAP